MNSIEIRTTIDRNNALIEKIMSPNLFTLNGAVYELLSENEKLREQCEHVFEEGYCIFCDKMENIDE